MSPAFGKETNTGKLGPGMDAADRVHEPFLTAERYKREFHLAFEANRKILKEPSKVVGDSVRIDDMAKVLELRAARVTETDKLTKKCTKLIESYEKQIDSKSSQAALHMKAIAETLTKVFPVFESRFVVLETKIAGELSQLRSDNSELNNQVGDLRAEIREKKGNDNLTKELKAILENGNSSDKHNHQLEVAQLKHNNDFLNLKNELRRKEEQWAKEKAEFEKSRREMDAEVIKLRSANTHSSNEIERLRNVSKLKDQDRAKALQDAEDQNI